MSQSPLSINSDSEVENEELALIGSDEVVEDTKKWIKTRYILALMGFLGFANVYAMRVNLSVAIVAMVNNSAIAYDNSTVVTDVCLPVDINNSTIPQKDGEFAWDESTQGLILGSFFYGYVLTQVPGGRMAELYGGKLVFGIGVLITGIFTALSPLAARLNFSVFIAVRIIEGLGEGVTFPAMHVMLARWIPPLERSKFAAYTYAGAHFGTVVSLPLSGYLCSLDFLGGWPLSFYLFGALSVLWFLVWLFVVTDSPRTHSSITEEEKNFILASIGEVRETDEDDDGIPWRGILTSLPLWAILVTQCGQSWAFYTQLTELPTYMKNILHFDIEQNALLSALPYLATWWFGVVLSLFADQLLSRGYLSPLASYKLFNSIASILPALCLAAVAWAGCDRIAILVLLVVGGGMAGGTFAGNQMNHISLSPRFAGTMYGITNAAANTCGFLAPYVVGLLINGKEVLSSWQLVFYIAAVINFAGNLFYLMFASAAEQPWNRRRRPKTDFDDDDVSTEPSPLA